LWCRQSQWEGWWKLNKECRRVDTKRDPTHYWKCKTIRCRSHCHETYTTKLVSESTEKYEEREREREREEREKSEYLKGRNPAINIW
jgi:hypothetical protein